MDEDDFHIGKCRIVENILKKQPRNAGNRWSLLLGSWTGAKYS
jgi:hypothetical protein